MPPSSGGTVPGENPLPRATLRDLVGRALVAFGGARCDPADEAWAGTILEPAEFDLWKQQSVYDRHHSVRVARRVEQRLAQTAHGGNTLWTSAALMHDVGKHESNLSLPERALATLAARVVPVDTARRWSRLPSGTRKRIGLYLIHGEIGAAMIRAAGGREPIAAWTEFHQGYHLAGPAGIPAAVFEALLASDVA
jgi:hypothetical protein